MEKPTSDWSKNTSAAWWKFNGAPRIPWQTCRFHAGFGKSDLTRVFWESRATRVTAQFHIAAADTRREERPYFSRKGPRAILGISPALFTGAAHRGGGCLPSVSRNRAAWKRYTSSTSCAPRASYSRINTEYYSSHRASQSHILLIKLYQIWIF